MAKLLALAITSRRSAALALCLAAAAVGGAFAPAAASASTSQLAMIQDGGVLGANAQATFEQFRELGANMARITLPWSLIAPNHKSFKKPSGFNATDPNAYRNTWAPYDNALRLAKRYGIAIDLTVTGGAPQWAEAKVPGGYNDFYAFRPNASEYGKFMQAVATRYDGHFTPRGQSSALPAVRFWAIFNEANFGEDLGPQAIDGSKVSIGPMMYRSLASAGWNALQSTGHQHDTIVIGEFAARGISGGPSARAPQGYPGNFGQTKPLEFIRTLYCVDAHFNQLRGNYAKQRGCPTSASASRRFRSQNPALFNSSGVGDHPYPDNGSPVFDGRNQTDFATFPNLGNLASTLDRVSRAYGSHRKLSIYNDEYGYITHPPARSHYVSQATAAYYINWAEYLSWKNSRLKSYMQYLLNDPPQNAGPFAQFDSGLINPNGTHKPTYDAYRLPFYMPKTSFSRTQNVEVWGAVRPAPFLKQDGNGTQSVEIQLQSRGHGAYKTVQRIRITNSGGYFDLKLRFGSGGNVRLAYQYPAVDTFLPLSVGGSTVHSRSFAIKVQ